MRLLFCVCIICLASCEAPQQHVTPPASLQGASLGAPEENKEALTQDVEADIARDIIIKNAGTEDEMMVSRAIRRPPALIKENGLYEDTEEMHQGQRVGDFVNIKQIDIPGYQTVYFSKLSSFVYFKDFGEADHPAKDMNLLMHLHDQNKAELGDKQIPEDIRKLHTVSVAIPGFMMATEELKDGKTNEFLLVQVIPSCFYCRYPNESEWIVCKTPKGEFADYHHFKPVLVMGTMEVGAYFTENDYLDSIYRITVDEVRPLKD